MTKKPSWAKSLRSHIWIFNVGRGLSIFIRTGLNQGIMYDLGSSDEFSPCGFLKENIIPFLDEYKKHKIAQTVISHPHADHISEINQLLPQGKDASVLDPSLHTCPNDKEEGSAKPEAINWERIKNPDGSDENIESYKTLYKKRSLPLQTIRFESERTIPNLEYGLYYTRPPKVAEIHESNDQDYGNGISLVLFYRHGKHTILIPGDITPDVFKAILKEDECIEKRFTCFDNKKTDQHPEWHIISDDQPSLKSLLKKHGLSILLAPHHGLESGFSEELYESINNNKPDLVVISEKRHESEIDGAIDSRYQSEDGASGMNVNIEGDEEKRYSVSTASGNHILITFEGTGGCPKVYLNSNPKELLKILD